MPHGEKRSWDEIAGGERILLNKRVDRFADAKPFWRCQEKATAISFGAKNIEAQYRNKNYHLTIDSPC
jgi:hypothetical protein